MKLNSPRSKQGIVNLLSDYILSNIEFDELSLIKVVDCTNFLVIKGKTTSKEVLNLKEIISNFKVKYSSLIVDEKILNHTIDVIEYDAKMEEVETVTLPFYYTDVCCFNYSQIEKYELCNEKCYNDDYIATELNDDLVFMSEFPFGHSMKMGRYFYYLGKHMIYNLPQNYPFTQLTLTLDKNPENLMVFDNFFKTYDKTLRSGILDCVNFEFNFWNNEIKKVDWSSEASNPLKEFDILKQRNRDFVII